MINAISHIADILMIQRSATEFMNDRIVYLVTQEAPIANFYFLDSLIVFERKGKWQKGEIEILEKALHKIGIDEPMKVHQTALPIDPQTGQDLLLKRNELSTKLKKWFEWIIPLSVSVSILIFVEGFIIYDTLTGMNK